MNNAIKVSIIMPVYNAINYIDTAIQSIINQTYKNYELIIIDDGATDGTGEVCKRYADENSNITYIRQNNAGTCVARNKGIELASGDYIAFSDHDDEYLSNYLEVLVNLVAENDLDIVKCGVYYEEAYADGTIKSRTETFKNEILTGEELVRRYNSLPISYFGVWNSLYKTCILRENHVRFPINVRHGQEDYFFNTDVVPFVRKLGFSEKCLYKHFRRISQSTSAKFYEDRIDAMSLYFNRECEVLQPLYSKQIWKFEHAIMYARKLTGVLSYIYGTLPECTTEKCIAILNRYLADAPYKGKLSAKEWLEIYKRQPKYALILFLTIHHRVEILIQLWKLKN